MQNIIVSFTSAVVFVLLGSVATELRWGGSHNNTFTCHEFLVVTVKEWLKSVYFYQSYQKNNSGVPLILDHPVDYVPAIQTVSLTCTVIDYLPAMETMSLTC